MALDMLLIPLTIMSARITSVLICELLSSMEVISRMGDYKRVESEGWSPDAEQRLADWTKHTWHLPHDADQFLEVLRVSSASLAEQQSALDKFCSLPAAHAIPVELAEELRGKGLSLR